MRAMTETGAHEAVNDFGAIADVYDELVEWAPYELWVEELERRLRRWGLRPGARLLDAACGTGLSVVPWARRGYSVGGADVSEPMLDRARRRLEEAGLTAELARQDMLDLRFERPFDAAVVMHSGLDYILEEADLERAFRSLRGCLRRGGLLAFDKCLDEPAFYEPTRTETRRLHCGRARFTYRWDRRRRLLEQRLVVERTEGEPARTEMVFHLRAVPPDELVAMVLRAGFALLERPARFRVHDPGMGIFRAV
jgi:ubiquinone/menaquinone biosynthesis C-methylase UbiE